MKTRRSLCLRISKNSKHLCVAGVGKDGVLSAIVSWAGGVGTVSASRAGKGEAWLSVGGLYDKRPGLHAYPSWLSSSPLHVGDRILITVVNAVPDPPSSETLKTKQSIRNEWRKNDEAARKSVGVTRRPMRKRAEAPRKSGA